MSYEVNDIEFEKVSKLPTSERYKYFIKKVCDWSEIWSVRHVDGWGLIRDGKNIECAPVWPAHKYAAVFCTDQWESYHPEPIPLEDWLKKWIPGLSYDKRKIVVFPSLSTDTGVAVSPETLKCDIERELEEYY